MILSPGKEMATKKIQINTNNPTNLDKKIMEELAKAPATQLDLYFLRGDLAKVERKLDLWIDERKQALDGVRDLINRHIDNHEALRAEITAFQEEMKKNLLIKIDDKSGQKLASIAEISLINYRDLRFLRDFNKVYVIAKKHKIITVLLLGALTVYGGKLQEFIQWALSLIGIFNSN